MRVLLIESSANYPSNPLFVEALQEIAQDLPGSFHYSFVDEACFLRQPGSAATRIARRLLRRSSIDQPALGRALIDEAQRFQPSLILICKGAFLEPRVLSRIKCDTGAVLVNYATDDPFNPAVSTRALVEAIPIYDVYVCTKRAIMDDVAQAGCKRVVYLPFAYKPSVHFPELPRRTDELARFDCDVVFAGGCDRDRAPFFKTLVRAIPCLNLALYGGYWNRSIGLRHYWRGFAMGREYRMALGGAKIAINLVRRSNRDGHVMRSFEIPACGAFMLAERTDEHRELFAESRESAYFDSPDELVETVKYYLPREEERLTIAARGHDAVTRGKHTYRNRLCQIIREVRKLTPLGAGVALS
jgi:spore maturation protein CgeB